MAEQVEFTCKLAKAPVMDAFVLLRGRVDA
jgi:hypothetical protein